MSGSQTIRNSDTRIEALTIQSSTYGAVIALCYGVTRVAGNLAWYGGFTAVPRTETQGGKGGGVKTQNTTYTYTASVIMGLCHGQVSGITQVWRGKKLYSGGVTSAQIITVAESYFPPASGAMTFAPVHASALTAVVGVTYSTPETDGGGGTTTLSLGVDYTVDTAGVFTFTNGAYRGLELVVAYQYTTGTVSQTALDQLGLTFIPGRVGQALWSGLSTFGAQAIGYSGLAAVAGTAYDLGTGAQVENHSFEVVGPMAYHLGSSIPDVDPSLVLLDVLSNARYGAAFPPANLDDWSAWSDYCVANGLWIAPAITTQTKAAELVQTVAKLTNTGPVWSNARLRMVPFADAGSTGNGRTFTPNTTPVYDLDDDCWLAGDNPVKSTAKTPADQYNHVRVQYRDRGSQYNAAVVDAKDQADIDANGLRSADVYDAPWICDGATARQVAQLLLQRALYVVRTFEFTLPWHYALLEPMDLVTITDAGLGLNRWPARIASIDEDGVGDLRVTAEELPSGVATAALYNSQDPSGYQPDYNASPGNVDTPAFFESPAALVSTGLEVCAAVRGVSANWGGCQVWVSFDGTRYRQVGTVYGSSRYGTLSAAMTAVATSMGVTGISRGQLVSGSAADASQLATLCYVGGVSPEYLAHQGATLTGTGAYTLAGLVRAAYGTSAAAHVLGAQFVRVDDRLARSGALDTSMVGQVIYFKFLSFNTTGGGQQGLADVSAYTYTVTGNMLALVPGQGGKGLRLTPSASTFTYDGSGTASPSSITITLTRQGGLTGTAIWTVQSGTATLTGSGDSRILTAANLVSTSAVISAAITDVSGTYTDTVTITKAAAAVNRLLITIYLQAASLPAAPGGGSYTFTGAVFVPPAGGWSATRPSPTTVPTWATSYLFETTTPDIPVPGPLTSGDPYWGSVSALLLLDGANNSTTFTDSSTYGRAVARGGTTKLSTAQAAAGTASGIFNGTADYLQFAGASPLDFPGDVTVEMFVNPTAIPIGTAAVGLINHRVMDTFGTGTWGLDIKSGGALQFGNWQTVVVHSGGAIAANTWTHVAWTRSGGTNRLFVGGITVATWSDSTDFTNGNAVNIGVARATGGTAPANFNSFFTGYIDSLRVTKGVARYTADFTVPSAAFPTTYGTGWPAPWQDQPALGALSVTATTTSITFDGIGTASPSSQTVSVTANLTGGLTGTASFTCTLYNAAGSGMGTVTMGGSGNTRTLTNTQFTSLGAAQSAVVIATLSGYTAQVTINQVQAPSPTIALRLSATSVAILADATGYIASYANAVTTASVSVNGVDDTSNWTLSIASTSGITTVLSGALVSITSMTTDAAQVTVTATRSGYATQSTLFSVTRVNASSTSSGPVAPNFTASAGGGGTVVAAIRFNTDGTVSVRQGRSLVYINAGNWYVPTTSGIGSSYWLKVTPRSGYTGSSAGTSGAWVALSSAQIFSEMAASPGDDFESLMDYQISSSSSGSPVVATGGTVYLHATA